MGTDIDRLLSVILGVYSGSLLMASTFSMKQEQGHQLKVGKRGSVGDLSREKI